MNEKRITCWHFLTDDKCLRWGTKEVVKMGKTYTATGPLEMCKNGMHGSRRLIDALGYAPGSILCKVQIWGEVEEQGDKLVGRNRKVLAMADTTMMLHEAGCHFAETALKLVDCRDERSWNAIKVKRLWIKVKATNKELAAAWVAAGAAAWVAAGDAARDAAGDAARDAARDAAGDAARDAAGDAARAAARDAAGDAARAAARDAAWAAAWAADRAAQNKYLITQANKLFAKQKTKNKVAEEAQG